MIRALLYLTGIGGALAGWLFGLAYLRIGPFKPQEQPELDPPPLPDPPAVPPPPMPITPTPKPPPPPMNALETVYAAAKAHIGQHLTLDASVPAEVGCVEALSKVLKEAGYAVPPKGIQGVNTLIVWMLAHGFKELPASMTGCIITAHARAEGNPVGAHCGVVMKFGICSNSSANGRWEENYASPAAWVRAFPQSATRYFRPV